MHRRLRGYKDAPVDEVRRSYRQELAHHATAWLGANDRLVRHRFGPRWELVATVPSSCRPGRTPVDSVVREVPALAGPLRTLLVRGRATTGHLRADRLGFVLAPGADPDRLRNTRVLLIDDSVVTGARAQSAAATLRLAGAGVVGVLALGRVVQSHAMWPPA
jgi:glutamine phosphoribosylpyrophosphate amidotransferase